MSVGKVKPTTGTASKIPPVLDFEELIVLNKGQLRLKISVYLAQRLTCICAEPEAQAQ